MVRVLHACLSVCQLTACEDLPDLPDVLNDWDFDLATNPAAARAYINDQRNVRKIKETARKLQVRR